MDPDTLPRGWDHLGNIRKELSGLAGYATLAHELFQNAEDAGATRLTFRVDDTELVVENERQFSDCRQVDRAHRDCPWLKQGKASCDFHNITWIGAGLKRDRAGVIGKFGVGLLAVYQITDRPEVMSGTRHWTFREELDEQDRIGIHRPCDHVSEVEGTRFRFPYALDDRSTLRKKLAQPALTWRSPDELVEAIVTAAPRAMLFLETLATVEVYRGKQLVTRLERDDDLVDEGVRLRVVAGQGVDESWYLFSGDFADGAETLRERYGPDKIEEGRGATVNVAVKVSEPVAGVLFAGLPTNTATGLPFLIDATFFPSPDRKRVIDDRGDYRTEWNLAAMDAAGQLFATHLPDLRAPLGPVPYWALIRGVADSRDAALTSPLLGAGQFWERTAAIVRETESAFDSTGRWVRPGDAPILAKPEETASLPALHAIGIRPMDEGLRAVLMSGRLPRTELAMRDLAIDDVISAIASVGLSGDVPAGDAPGALGTPEGLAVLWTEIEVLLAAAASQKRPLEAIHGTLQQRSIALTEGGALVPLGQAHRADGLTRGLLEAMGLDVLLLVADMDQPRPILEHCPVVDVATLVDALEHLEPDEISARWQAGRYSPSALLAWLADRPDQLDAASETVHRLKRLRLFPAGDELEALDHMAIPGDFQDPLQLADVMTLPDLLRHRAVLALLGARELTIGEYARVQVPRAIRSDHQEPAIIRKVVRVLADHVFDLEGNDSAREALRGLPIIECADGIFRNPAEVVVDGELARDVLGADGPLARLPEAAPLRHQQLWTWLGIVHEPDASHLDARIEQVLQGSMDNSAEIAALERVCGYLNRKRTENTFAALVGELREREWLPADDDEERWYRPSELYPVFQDYLFRTQAKFLAFSRPIQGQIADLLFDLGMPSRPPVRLIVDHLLTCAERGVAVNRQVWEALSQGADDPAIQRLRRRECLLVDGDGTRYRRPDEVFWKGPDFGGLRVLLGTDLARYRPFFDAIGVKDEPDVDAAIGVLQEIASLDIVEVLPENLQRGVHEAWALISAHMDDGEIPEIASLGETATALGRDGALHSPRRLYVEDRPLLVDKFGDAIRGRVVGFDPAIVRALRFAGARDFSQVVSVVRLYEGEGDTRAATVLALKLEEQWPAIVRIVVALGDDLEFANVDAGPAFDCYEVDDLWIRYEIPDEPGVPSSEEEQPEAIFVPIQASLYVRGAGVYHWRHVARELGVALCGPREAHRVSSYLSEVLRAASLTDAHDALDELGVARLNLAEAGGPPEVVAGALGGVETGDEIPLGTDQTRGTPESPAEPGAERPDGTEEEGGRDDTTGRRGDGRHGQPQDTGSGGGVGGTGGHGGGPRGSTTSRRSGQARDDGSDEMLRSWVKSPGAASRELTMEEKARREATDRAGIERAMRYEREAGRNPTEMPHDNEGYDIESRVDGVIVRFIEVKAQSGAWRSNAPSMSKPQHDHAVQKSGLYWLYVVEQAGQAGEEIHVIQDPIGRATHFGFDPGWREVAFDADAPYEELEPEPDSDVLPA